MPIFIFSFVTFVLNCVSIEGARELSDEIDKKHLHLNFTSSTGDEVDPFHIRYELDSLGNMFIYKIAIEYVAAIILVLQIALRKSFKFALVIVIIISMALELPLFVWTMYIPYKIPLSVWEALSMDNYYDAGICGCFMGFIYIIMACNHIKMD